MSAFLAKFYEAVIIVMAVFLLIACLFGGFKTWQAKHFKTQLENAELKCDQEKDAIHTEYQTKANEAQQAYQAALFKQQHKINQLSTDYEQAKAERKTEVEYRTRTIYKVVDRPIYLNQCADDDGLSELNSLIKSRSAS